MCGELTKALVSTICSILKENNSGSKLSKIENPGKMGQKKIEKYIKNVVRRITE